jgi:hypothetical protein
MTASVFSFVAGRVSPRRATHFLLLRQKKVSKEKATLVSATPALRYGATCAARKARAGRKLALRAQTCVPLFPRFAALLGAATREWGAEDKQDTCTGMVVGANARASGSYGCSVPHAIEAVPSSAALGGSGLALFERSEFSQTPPDASSAGNREAARTQARLLFAYFLLAKQEKVSRPPGRDPACPASKHFTQRANTKC